MTAAEQAGIVADGFGALLSAEKPRGQRDFAVEADPQLVNPTGHFLEWTEGWVNLSDAIQAQGGERWLTLGNFDRKGQTRIAASANAPSDATKWAYVYVDGVEVVPVDRPEDCACLVRKIADEMQDPPEPLTRVRELERDTLHFDFDSDALSEEGRQVLDTWGAQLRRNRFLRLEVHGHTDDVGPEGYNAGLSQRRAAAAFDYLMDQGVQPDRMRMAAHGGLPAGGLQRGRPGRPEPAGGVPSRRAGVHRWTECPARHGPHPTWSLFSLGMARSRAKAAAKNTISTRMEFRMLPVRPSM